MCECQKEVLHEIRQVRLLVEGWMAMNESRLENQRRMIEMEQEFLARFRGTVYERDAKAHE